MKQQPEATMALIGSSLEFLDNPIAAFVRLADARQLGKVTELTTAR